MKEQTFQKNIIDLLELNGYYVRKNLVTMGGKIGTPDLMGCTPKGKFFAIEVKVLTGTSKLQEYNLREINKRGGTAFVLTYAKDWKEALWENIKI